MSASTPFSLAAVAEYAALPLTPEEIAASEAMLQGLLAVLRATPNDPLTATEPAAVFRHLPPAGMAGHPVPRGLRGRSRTPPRPIS